jgi:hypothetical protein
MDANDFAWIQTHLPSAHQTALAWHADMACSLDSARFARERLLLDADHSKLFCLGVSIVEKHRRTEFRELLLAAHEHAVLALEAAQPGTEPAARVGHKVAMIQRLLVEVAS